MAYSNGSGRFVNIALNRQILPKRKGSPVRAKPPLRRPASQKQRRFFNREAMPGFPALRSEWRLGFQPDSAVGHLARCSLLQKQARCLFADTGWKPMFHIPRLSLADRLRGLRYRFSYLVRQVFPRLESFPTLRNGHSCAALAPATPRCSTAYPNGVPLVRVPQFEIRNPQFGASALSIDRA
jgi:hypothetical protein